MSESWAIGLVTLVLGWLSLEIRSLNKSMRRCVDKPDCEKGMSSHCVRLEKLEAKVGENSEKLAAIEQYHRDIERPIDAD